MYDRTTEVVVAGAGPTGLVLASELTLAGARVVVVERNLEPDLTPKAGSIGALASEVLERRGLGPALDAAEAPALEAMQAMRRSRPAHVDALPRGPRRPGGHFAGLSLLDQELQREPDRRMRWIPQEALERVLASHASALGVEIWRGHSIEAFDDDGARVRVEVRGPEGSRSIDAAFLVGCDGGRSTVRKRAGFDFPGTDPTLTLRQALVELDHPERIPLGWQRTAAGMMSFWAHQGEGAGPKGRVVLIEFDGPPADREAPVTRAELEDSLRRVSGADVRVVASRSATRWTDNARQASSYRRGRVLLAGDAAHIHSPFGGQGLNLGLVDAANLGWKLAATVRGRAPDGLLDTYMIERHPVAERVLENTRAQVTIMRPDPQASAMRSLFADLLTNNADANRQIGEMISGVTTRYDLGDADPLVGRLVSNLELTVGGAATRLYALVHDGRGLLVDGREAAGRMVDGREAAGRMVDGREAAGSVVDGDAEAIVQANAFTRVRVVAAPGARSMLVRPDGCVAWAGRAGGLPAALERWFSAA